MTTRRLGRHALDLLMQLANPGHILLSTPSRREHSLLRRGLIAPQPRGGWRITPAGLDHLAAALRDGTIDTHLAATKGPAR